MFRRPLIKGIPLKQCSATVVVTYRWDEHAPLLQRPRLYKMHHPSKLPIKLPILSPMRSHFHEQFISPTTTSSVIPTLSFSITRPVNISEIPSRAYALALPSAILLTKSVGAHQRVLTRSSYYRRRHVILPPAILASWLIPPEVLNLILEENVGGSWMRIPRRIV